MGKLIRFPAIEVLPDDPEKLLDHLKFKPREDPSVQGRAGFFEDGSVYMLFGDIEPTEYDRGWGLRMTPEQACAYGRELTSAALYARQHRIREAGAVSVYWSKLDGSPVWSQSRSGVIVERLGIHRVRIKICEKQYRSYSPSGRPEPNDLMWFCAKTRAQVGHNPKRRHWRYREEGEVW